MSSRDLLELAALPWSDQDWGQAVDKANTAYGLSLERDLQRMSEQPGWVDRCYQMLAVAAVPSALRLQLQCRERRLSPSA